jgi:hypothetical protein
MNKKDEQHIRITYSVGFSVEFLDVYAENCNGLLQYKHQFSINQLLKFFFRLNQAMQVLTELDLLGSGDIH